MSINPSAERKFVSYIVSHNASLFNHRLSIASSFYEHEDLESVSSFFRTFSSYMFPILFLMCLDSANSKITKMSSQAVLKQVVFLKHCLKIDY